MDVAGPVCVALCKATGAYPSCSGCSNFVPPDPTPGVMTWPETFKRMDDLVDWGRDQLKTMRKFQAMALQQKGNKTGKLRAMVLQQKTNKTNATAPAS